MKLKVDGNKRGLYKDLQPTYCTLIAVLNLFQIKRVVKRIIYRDQGIINVFVVY